MNFVAIDFETANEQRQSACAIGLTEVEDGRIKESIYHLVRPMEMRFSDWNTRIHGIRADDVCDSPTIAELFPSIRHLLEGKLLIAHNASFDMSVLRHSFQASSVEIPRFSYLCSLQIARRAWPRLASYSLGFLAEIHKLALDHHHAGSDSRACAELVILASKAHGAEGIFRLAEVLGVNFGEVVSSDEWIPSSALPCHQNSHAARIEIMVPDGYDITLHPFYRKSVVFTGKLTYFQRENAQEIISFFGGTPSETVSKGTHYLVVGFQDIRAMANGSNQSSKMKKARHLQEKGFDIQIISDADFNELIFYPSGKKSKGN